LLDLAHPFSDAGTVRQWWCSIEHIAIIVEFRKQPELLRPIGVAADSAMLRFRTHPGLCAPIGAKGYPMAYVRETGDELSRRMRNGKITAFLAITWWVASIGGIIYVINNPA
jgi:hypothetical protein